MLEAIKFKKFVSNDKLITSLKINIAGYYSVDFDNVSLQPVVGASLRILLLRAD
jgi:hypothetical protein